MRQFDVYPNRSPSTRRAYPYLVDIQCDALSELNTRVVVPLVRASAFADELPPKLAPRVSYDGEALLLLVPQLASVSRAMLGDPKGSLRQLRSDIVAAVDFTLTGV